MSRQRCIAQYSRLLGSWPIDRLRPEERHFRRIFQARIDNPDFQDANAEKEINAAQLLLDNTFAKRYPLPERIMKPQSDPKHYDKLATELTELPDRTWSQRLMKRLQGMVRLR